MWRMTDVYGYSREGFLELEPDEIAAAILSTMRRYPDQIDLWSQVMESRTSHGDEIANRYAEGLAWLVAEGYLTLATRTAAKVLRRTAARGSRTDPGHGLRTHPANPTRLDRAGPVHGVNVTGTGRPCCTSSTVRSPSGAASSSVAVRGAPTAVQAPIVTWGWRVTMTTTARSDSTASAV